MTQEKEMLADPYMRIVTIFDQDPTAGAFLSEDGEGGFAAGVHRMAREIDTLRALLKPFAGSQTSITQGRLGVVRGAEPRDFMNAKAYFGETVPPDESPQTERNVESLRAALEPFAEAMFAHGDPYELDDDQSALHAIRDGQLTITGVSLGDLRKARDVYLNSARKVK
jgi:hypothetical protein